MFFLILSFFVAPYSEHSFILEAIRKMYLVKTTDMSLFERPKSEKHLVK